MSLTGRFLFPVVLVALLLGTASWASAATRKVSPGGANSGDCAATPCATLGYAYGVAAPGDTIEVGAGDYPIQYVPSGTKAVTFRGVPGNRLRQLDNKAHNVTFDGLDVDAGGSKPSTAVFESHGVDNVTFKNGRIGNVSDQKGALVSGTNFTFDNVSFHDAVMTTPDTHMECVFAIGVPGFVVRNSTFHNCAVMDLFFVYGNWWTPLPPAYGNVTIENNVFEHVLNSGGSWNYYPLYIGQTGNATLDGWVVRYNTFEQNASVTTSHNQAVNSRWVGNLGGWDCIPGMVYSHNVGRTCGPTDKAVAPNQNTRTTIAPLGWVNPAGADFHLKAGSPAIDAGDPKDAPNHDRDCRPRDARPDAGAYEFGTSGDGCSAPVQSGGGAPPAAPPGATGGRALRIRTARLKRRVICRRARRGCPRSTRLVMRLSRPARVNVRIKRVRKGGPAQRVRTIRAGAKQRPIVPIKARGLRPGRYRVVATAVDGGTRSRSKALKLRVR